MASDIIKATVISVVWNTAVQIHKEQVKVKTFKDGRMVVDSIKRTTQTTGLMALLDCGHQIKFRGRSSYQIGQQIQCIACLVQEHEASHGLWGISRQSFQPSPVPISGDPT